MNEDCFEKITGNIIHLPNNKVPQKRSGCNKVVVEQHTDVNKSVCL